MPLVLIFQQVILPILILIGVGMLLHRVFRFELKTISKLLLYYYVPALAFVKIYESQVTIRLLALVFTFLALQFLVLWGIALFVSKFLRYDKPMTSSFSNSVLLTNCANVGIPVNDFTFRHDPFAMSIQMMVVLFEILVTFTIGLFNASAAHFGWKKTLGHFLKMPVLYCIILAFVFRYFHLQVPNSLWIPLNLISDGMLSLALVALGAQISFQLKLQKLIPIFVSSFIRLMISPLIAFLLLTVLGIKGVAAQALLIASAMPTSRNSAALALEYGNEPQFAANAVLFSTLASSVTLTLVIYWSSYLA